MKFSATKKLLIEETNQAALHLKHAIRGLSIGELIKLIRTELGLSQTALASLAGVPQSTVSRVENGHRDVNLSTLQKILEAMSCELIIAPLLLESIESLQLKQAKIQAQKRLQYLKGTMNLEQQQPDEKFIQELIKKEEARLLRGPKSKLWEK